MTVCVAGMLASTSGPPKHGLARLAWIGASGHGYGKSEALAPGRRRWYYAAGAYRGICVAAIVPMVDLWPVAAAFPAEGYRMLYPGSLSLFGFIGFSVLKIPNGWSNPLYLAPLFVSVVLTYGMFWFVWAYFGALIAFACLAGPYVLAEITGALLPIRIRTILVFVAFVGSILCADMAVHMGEFG